MALCAFAVLFTGCSGATGFDRAALVPDRTAPTVGRSTRGDLLYISEYGGGVLDVFSYPQGKFIQSIAYLDGTPQGECVDNKGDVWVVEIGGHPTIEEFSHDGSPIGSLSDQGENPYGCSIDPVTGDLAVSSEYGSTSFQGSVAVWKKAAGTPTVYVDRAIQVLLWCGYDNKGNLFVDGLPPSGKSEFAFAELPKGSKTLTNIKLKGIVFPGNIQWDGSSLTVGVPSYKSGSAIFQVKVSGSNATITGKTVLEKSYEVYGSWIAGGTVIGPDDGPSLSTVQLWRYPAGGKPTMALSKGSSTFFNGPFGAAVSPGK
ncbi:MAG TPA: hypothetical protein VKR56_01110 [Candidatus Cybelea sp.]|nr:hypothetical protein [Candidatus Cybelea sp.]